MNFAGLKCSNHVIYTWLKVKDWLNIQLPKSSEMTVNLVRFESVGRGDKKGQQLAAEDKGN